VPVELATVNGEMITTEHPDIQYWISYYLYQLSASGYDTSDAELMQTVNQYSLLNTIRFVVLRQKAAEMGLATFTDEEKATAEAEAKAAWEEIIAGYVESAGITDDSSEEDKAAARADAEAEMLLQGYDEASYINDYVENDETNTIINRLRDALSKDITVTDEDVQEYFNDLVTEDKEAYAEDVGSYEFYTQYYQQPSYYTPEGYRAVNHILLEVDEELLNKWKDLTARFEEQQSNEEAEPTDEELTDEEAQALEIALEDEDVQLAAEVAAAAAVEAAEEAGVDLNATPEPTAEPVTQEMIDAAVQAILDSVRPTVDEIKAKLAEGVSFDDLILEYGTDPGMKDEATRAAGYLVHKDSILWDPAFTSAAMALEKVGDVGEPVVGQYGVHILHYLKDVPGGAVELTSEMKEEFRTELLDEKKDLALNEALEQWVKEAKVEYTEAGKAWELPPEVLEDDEEDETGDEAVTEAPAEEATATPTAEAAATPTEEPAATTAP